MLLPGAGRTWKRSLEGWVKVSVTLKHVYLGELGRAEGIALSSRVDRCRAECDRGRGLEGAAMV